MLFFHASVCVLLFEISLVFPFVESGFEREK